MVKIHIIGIPEEEDSEIGREKYLKKMAETFLYLLKS